MDRRTVSRLALLLQVVLECALSTKVLGPWQMVQEERPSPFQRELLSWWP